MGLLAGSGRFPIAFAEKAREVGLPVVCVGLGGIAAPELRPLVHRFHWSGAIQIGRMIRLFKREGVRRLVMAGKVPKAEIMHNPWKLLTLLPDLRTIRMYYFGPRRDNRDDSLLLAVVEEFASEGLTFESALTLCPELLVKPGVLTRRARRPARKPTSPSAGLWRGKWVALTLAKAWPSRIAPFSLLKRLKVRIRQFCGGRLCCAGGFIVVKVAKPNQDMRFDVPTVGCDTIETLRRSGGRVLALEADQTIFLDQAAAVALADRYGLTVVALAEPKAA